MKRLWRLRVLWEHWKDLRSGDRFWHPLSQAEDEALANYFFSGYGIEDALHAVRFHDGEWCDDFVWGECLAGTDEHKCAEANEHGFIVGND